MKYFDAFTGYGGFTLAINNIFNETNNRSPGKNKKEADTKGNLPDIKGKHPRQLASCIGFSEIEKDKKGRKIFAKSVYQFQYSNHKDYGSITDIDETTLPDFDLFTGGFPCQSFSVAGKRGGFEDTRGTLIFDVLRICAHKKPKHILLENVKGLLSHDSGRTFGTIIEAIQEIGYGVSWKVLNAKDFGVPQNRERVFILCVRGEPAPEILPIGKANSKNNGEIKQLNKPIHSNDRVYAPDGISPTLNTMQGGRRQPFIKEDKIRRLTPLECERLMGLPDNWTKQGTDGKISDTQRYKLCGNGVVVNCVEAIVKQINRMSTTTPLSNF